MLHGPIDLTTNCSSAIITLTGFLHIIYAILNASVSDSREKFKMHLMRNKKQLKSNKSCLARNETRDGNFLLSGTVALTSGL